MVFMVGLHNHDARHLAGTIKEAMAGARSVMIKFYNHTGFELIRDDSTLRLHGGVWVFRPPPGIPPHTAVIWMSESNGFATGTEGEVGYQIFGSGDPDVTLDDDGFHIRWNNPFVGSNTYILSDPGVLSLKKAGGSGNNAFLRVGLHAE